MTIKKQCLSNYKQLLESLETQLEDFEEIEHIQLQTIWSDSDNQTITAFYSIVIHAYPEHQDAFTYYVTKKVVSKEEEE